MPAGYTVQTVKNIGGRVADNSSAVDTGWTLVVFAGSYGKRDGINMMCDILTSAPLDVLWVVGVPRGSGTPSFGKDSAAYRITSGGNELIMWAETIDVYVWGNSSTPVPYSGYEVWM